MQGSKHGANTLSRMHGAVLPGPAALSLWHTHSSKLSALALLLMLMARYMHTGGAGGGLQPVHQGDAAMEQQDPLRLLLHHGPPRVAHRACHLPQPHHPAHRRARPLTRPSAGPPGPAACAPHVKSTGGAMPWRHAFRLLPPLVAERWQRERGRCRCRCRSAPRLACPGACDGPTGSGACS